MNSDRPVHAANVPTPTERPRRQIAHEEIARRAEELWRERGWPAGQDEAIWLEAESKLQGETEAQPVAQTPSRSTAAEPAKPGRSQTKSRDPAEAKPGMGTGRQMDKATEGG